MSERLILTNFGVKPRPHGAYFIHASCSDAVAFLPTDGDVGHIATAMSAIAKSIYQQVTGFPVTPTVQTTAGIVLDQFRVDRLYVAPYRWHLVMEQGPYKFTCNLDRDLEHILAGFSAALKFFAMKHGRILLYDEVARNADRAHEQGFENNPQ